MNEYGFESFERGVPRGMRAMTVDEVKDSEVAALFDVKDYNNSTATACCNVASTDTAWSSINALESSVAALSCNTTSVTSSIEEVGKALKVLSERVSKLEKNNDWGGRLKRSDLRTLRVG